MQMGALRYIGLGGLLSLLLGGCSQKDPGTPMSMTAGAGGAGGSGGGDMPSDVATDYYPMVAGSTLTYRHSNNGPSWDDVTQVTATDWQGSPAWLTEGTPDAGGETSKNTIIQLGTQILRVHKDEIVANVLTGTVDYEPGFIRFDRAWADEQTGFSVNIGYKRVEMTVSGTVLAEDNREHTFTIEAMDETVDVAAGTIEHCMRVHRLRVRANAANATDDDDKVFWFCQGIGKVKEVSKIGGSTEELASCDIAGGRCPE